jgi:ubiquinone/menaquinone biosynthesis C-methylase UbiE
VGLGEHLDYEKLSQEHEAGYVAVDLRPNMIEVVRRRFPKIQAGDCQTRMNFADGFFDRILDIHVLEHLPNLPAAAKELYRLCNKEVGLFQVVIPCEGSFAYSVARRLSAQRIFEALQAVL